MTAPLVERASGDVIPAADHNDVKDYIEDGMYRVNTKSLNIQGVGEVIGSSGYMRPIRIVAPTSNGIYFYASNGTSTVAKIDENGNLYLKGAIFTDQIL